MGMAITLFLASTVLMLVVSEMIPPTSDVIPLVGIYYLSAMLEMALMILVVCVTLKLHHKTADDPPMSSWMRK